MNSKHLPYLSVNLIIISIAVLLGYGFPDIPPTTSTQEQPIPSSSTFNKQSISILLDDFSPRPSRDESDSFFNRLDGDGGAHNNSIIKWGNGQMKIEVSPGNSSGGVWMSLNHPRHEHLPLNFSAVLPRQIRNKYQSEITDLTVQIVDGTPGITFRIELKEGNDVRWQGQTTLDGGEKTLEFILSGLGNIDHITLVLYHAKPGEFVVLDNVSFTATTSIMETAERAFVWSYGMLLNNWDSKTGLVRDKAKQMSGEFDAIQATGSLAAATAIAKQLDIINEDDAKDIVGRISNALPPNKKVLRKHGLWPHFVMRSPAGDLINAKNSEWSSVDTVIAALGLLTAQSGLRIDTSDTEQMLQAINWRDLLKPSGISHGYNGAGELFPHSWDIFGGETWLVELAYAGVMGHVPPITYPTPPTANGSGFIDEMAWLYVPPPQRDYWGTNWAAYRRTAANTQIAYYPTHAPTSCFSKLHLFGLSAAEAPSAAAEVPPGKDYQAFGVGGRSEPANDGSASLGAPVVVPHYSAMIASLRRNEAIRMWEWLIKQGYFSPLNNVESLTFPAKSECDAIVWNHLKGSWNLALQTLGWGRYLAEHRRLTPILWQAVTENLFLRDAYSLLSSKP